MQNQQYMNILPRQLSEQETNRYFFPRKVPSWTWITVLIGILIGIIGGILNINLIVISIGVILCVIGTVTALRIRKSNPTDDQYDQWLQEQAEDLYLKGLHTLNIDENDLIEQRLLIHSFVLPCSMLMDDYTPEEVLVTRGKDGQLRCSVNVYTYIFLTSRFIGVFESSINAFRHWETFERNEIYPYHYITNATTRLIRDMVLIGDKQYPYRIECFCLRTSSNSRIQFGAAVKAILLDRTSNAPTSLLPHAGFDRTLNKLRQLLL